MKLYNSETRQIEEFIPYKENEVKMYTCGPTVYHFAHIGNLRSYIMEDILEKSLAFLGYKVVRAMNITDVGHLSGDSDNGEDKMELGAKREHKTVMEIADFYTDAFRKDFESLNLTWPNIVVKATSCVDKYIEIISKLLADGFAYEMGGNIYFDTSKLNNYYRLTNQNSNDMIVGARDDVSEDNNKKNKNDFVLWFTNSKFENHALLWDSPFGKGYPGWHIECSGISYNYLGEYLDIHCGGVDNKFPHHTNEIAQTESYVGHKWCKYWFHVEHLLTNNGKMSKSSGEFLTVSLLKEKGYSPLAYKLFCLQSHYRNQLMFSYDGLDSAQSALNKIYEKIANIEKVGEVDNEVVKKYTEQFAQALANDLNTSLAITTLFDILKADTNGNTKLCLIEKIDKVLCLDLLNAKKHISTEIDDELKNYIEEMIEKRKQAKLDKNYALADEIRNELTQKDITIIDTKEGTTYKLN